MPKPFIFVTGLDTDARELVDACAKQFDADVLSDEDLYLDEPELMSDTEAYKHRIQQALSVVGFIGEETPAFVLHELGIAAGGGLPTILLTHSDRSPFIGFVDGRTFVFDDPLNPSIRDRLTTALREEIESAAQKRKRGRKAIKPSVFISYSHRDASFLERLMVHLRPQERSGTMCPWADTKIKPGEDWKSEIGNALSHAKVAILLISADFLASDFIANDELPPILLKAEEHGTLILPLVIKPCRFLREPSLSKFQCVNDPTKPIGLLSELEQEVMYDKVASEVERWLAQG